MDRFLSATNSSPLTVILASIRKRNSIRFPSAGEMDLRGLILMIRSMFCFCIIQYFRWAQYAVVDDEKAHSHYSAVSSFLFLHPLFRATSN